MAKKRTPKEVPADVNKLLEDHARSIIEILKHLGYAKFEVEYFANVGAHRVNLIEKHRAEDLLMASIAGAMNKKAKAKKKKATA